ncbi:Phospho-2-dehydro-3-deoxyheptonate aldolase 2, chloroplastic [Hondaea fermentalgiana]|uniref:Phospho-2-dehydro-3-deoxyheptonate aldolase n=1 Tax=Hondaea fermentalgiana TaxID=2315210 RepID=A0A2R5GT47_9STRA|nr:Phospho-2-dehydro-3-deoxyheptonate aldolase 2, chloroplastic [Hondaea fermentalgiana]|eukprot:GBG31561.1 Phospho-2-dehydro-3-deoxyheptonate aldolase 2, chloroplastic [Hondaea fermentalgiana]
MTSWSPSSWRELPAKQQPKYKDEDKLKTCIAKVRDLPPLVAVHEIEALRGALAECVEGKRFLLQGGDCAEQFDDCKAQTIENKIKILLQMSLVLTYGARTPTVRVARLAGQFAKPRSKDTEMVDGVELPSYRGDNVNGFDPKDREPDPERIVQGYFHSAATINYARVVIAEGMADLRLAPAWDMEFVKNAARRDQYQGIATRITDAMNFIETCGVKLDPVLQSVDMFTSHEGLHLEYEEAMTVQAPDGKWYNRSAHFLWIGDRTRQLDHAHIEYFRGIANPIGIKVGPSSKPDELVALIQRLWPNPAAAPGKIALITRFGADNVATMFPPLLKAVQEAGLPVLWTCDPMHGNTTTTTHGQKTRDFDAVLKEVEECIKVHASLKSRLGGVHFELTGDNVTECTGGPENLSETDLKLRYATLCDPRLNYSQSMEMAFRLSDHLIADAKVLKEANGHATDGQEPPAKRAKSD